MKRLPLVFVPFVFAAAVLSGCAEVQQATESARNAADTAGKAADCSKIAADMTQLQLDRVTAPGAVGDAAKDLEAHVRSIDDQDVRDAASKLADSAKSYAAAVARGDVTAIQRARQQVEQRARNTAAQCGVPVDVFIG